MASKKKVVLAYSGGLDTSIILHWLKKEHDYDVIAYCADVGQAEELDGLEEKAMKTGASKTYVVDIREEFVQNYVYKSLQGTAVYEMRYLLGTAIARPAIAKSMVEIAHKEGAVAVSHGATGKGNDQVRFESAFMALDPSLEIIAPWREWSFKGRNDLIEYARKENIPVTITPEKPYSMDRNALHISYEGGILEDPSQSPKEDMFMWTKSLEEASSFPVEIEVEFEQGIPVKIDNQSYTPYELLEYLNNLAAEHGIGRVDIVENRLVGIKSRGVYETPGGTVLHVAHRDLESIVLDRDLQFLKDNLSMRYGQLIYNGQWFSTEREALQDFITSTQRNLSGKVRLKLYKGNIIVLGRTSPHTLYSSSLASFEDEKETSNILDYYNQKDAEGFIRIFGLPSKVAYQSFIKRK